ncbi:hypothetical protein D3C86_1825480 [compost metagenome]
MQCHQQHALPFGLGRTNMLEPLDPAQPGQPRRRPPPADRHLEEGHAGRGEIFPQQAAAFSGRQLGETQLQVARGDLPTRTRQAIHQAAKPAPQPHQQRIRQKREQPQQAEPQP